MFAKKGQLSVETMIIYGLVILVAISVIGLLIYFDILDLGAYLPDKCDIGGTGDLKCEEWSLSGTTLTLGIRNIGQKTIAGGWQITAVDAEGVHFTGSASSDPTTAPTSDALSPGQIVAVDIDVGGGGVIPGQVFKGELTTTYTYAGGVVGQTAYGTARFKAS